MIEKIRQAFPFPAKRPDFKPFSWKLDGGGRELIFDLIETRRVSVMVEVGVLYGGSCLQWLRHKSDLFVIGVDPWQFEAGEVRYWWSNRFAYGIHNLEQGSMSDEEMFSQLLKPNAAYYSTLSNLWDYRDRFVPVRGFSPDMLQVIANFDVVPDVVYFDSDKKLDDLDVVRSLWPDAVVCGDDWTWSPSNDSDSKPVQNVVNQYAIKHNLIVESRDATWCLRAG